MRMTWTTVAALAAGGLLLKRLMGRRDPHTLQTFEQEARAHRGAGTALALSLATALAASTIVLSRRATGHGGMLETHESIELDVPVTTAYNQWTQFEEFPRFMASVEEVRQIDDTHQHWGAVVAIEAPGISSMGLEMGVACGN